MRVRQIFYIFSGVQNIDHEKSISTLAIPSKNNLKLLQWHQVDFLVGGFEFQTFVDLLLQMNDFVEEILELEVIIVNFALFLRRRVSRFLHAQMSHAIQTLQSDELLCSFGTEIRYGVGYN